METTAILLVTVWGRVSTGNARKPPSIPMPRTIQIMALAGEHKVGNEPAISDNDFVCLMSKINESNYPKGALSWISDSGCTASPAHMTLDQPPFDTYESVSDASVEVGTQTTTEVVGRGSIVLRLQCGSSFETRKLDRSDTLYCQ